MATDLYSQKHDGSSPSDTTEDTLEKVPTEESLYGRRGRFCRPEQLRAYFFKISIITIAAVILCAELLSISLSRSTQRHHEDHHQHESSSLPTTTVLAPTSQWTDCGHDAESALDRGCIFDTLTISWETPDCYDAETVNAFMQLKDWQTFTDVNATSTVSWDEVSQAERRYHVIWDFHFTHCIYTWKLMQKAVLKGLALEDNLLDMAHTEHCTNLLLDRSWSWDNKDTLIHVKWPKCYGKGEWENANFVDPFNVTATALRGTNHTIVDR